MLGFSSEHGAACILSFFLILSAAHLVGTTLLGLNWSCMFLAVFQRKIFPERGRRYGMLGVLCEFRWHGGIYNSFSWSRGGVGAGGVFLVSEGSGSGRRFVNRFGCGLGHR